MDKDSKLTDKDEAFEFSNEEDVGTEFKYSSQNPDNSGYNRLQKKGRKSLLMFIGMLIGCFLLYKLYGLLTVRHSNQPLAPIKKNVQVLKTSETAFVTTKNVANMSPTKESKTLEATAKPELTDLEKSVTESAQIQENLQAQITGLSSAISEIQNNIAMLTQKIKDFSEQNQSLQDKFNKIALLQEKAKKSIKKNVLVNNHHSSNHYKPYFLKALIHGRAWLMSSSGETVTVAEGDQLAGYGIIQRIDPDTATVNTSSGNSIRFLSQDR